MKPSRLILLAFCLMMASATNEDDVRACSDVEIRHVLDILESERPNMEECANYASSVCESIACKTVVVNFIEAIPDDCYIPADIVDYRNYTKAMAQQDAKITCPSWDF